MIADVAGPIVVTAVGGAPGFDLARLLINYGYQVIAADSNPYAAGLFLPGVTPVVVPTAGSAHYADHLLGVCRSERPAALIPCDEHEVVRLIEHQNQLSDLGVRTWLPSSDAAATCGDKAAFHRRVREHRIATPQSWLPDQLNEIQDGIELVVKPRHGHGSKNVLFCRTVSQARTLCELVDDPLVQERVAGTEFTADCLIDRDGTLSVIPRRRLMIKNGLAVAAATFHDDQVAEAVTGSLAAVGMSGLCCVQGFLTDGPDRVLITEINARIAGAFPISVAAGADLVGQFLNGLFGRPVDHGRLRFAPEFHLIKYVETMVAGLTPLAAARPIASPVPATQLLTRGTR